MDQKNRWDYQVFELSGFELSDTKYKTFLTYTQGTLKFVQNNESLS